MVPIGGITGGSPQWEGDAMIRTLLWLLLYLASLGSLSIDVRYSDGLHVKFNGWAKGWRRHE